MGAQRRQGQAVAQHQVVGGAQGGGAILKARRVAAFEVADDRGAARLVQRGIAVDAVAEAVRDHVGKLGKGLGGLAVLPAACSGQGAGQIPVVEREVGRDAPLQQRVDEPLVMVKPGAVDGAAPLGQHARPGHREAVGVVAQAVDERQVFAPAVVVVAGLGAVAGVGNAAGLVAEVVPPAAAAAIGRDSALDLKGRGGGAEVEATGKAGSQRIGHASRASMQG